MISITRDGDNKLANKQLQDLLASANRQEPKNADLFYRLASLIKWETAICSAGT